MPRTPLPPAGRIVADECKVTEPPGEFKHGSGQQWARPAAAVTINRHSPHTPDSRGQGPAARRPWTRPTTIPALLYSGLEGGELATRIPVIGLPGVPPVLPAGAGGRGPRSGPSLGLPTAGPAAAAAGEGPGLG